MLVFHSDLLQIALIGMPPLRAPLATLRQSVSECKDAIARFTEATKAASIYQEECTRLTKSIRRFQTFLDDLEDNHLGPEVEKQGIAVIKVLTWLVPWSDVFSA